VTLGGTPREASYELCLYGHLEEPAMNCVLHGHLEDPAMNGLCVGTLRNQLRNVSVWTTWGASYEWCLHGY